MYNFRILANKCLTIFLTFFFSHFTRQLSFYVLSRIKETLTEGESEKNLSFPIHVVRVIGGFHAISGDTNNNGEMNKCWWTNKAS